jgi:hypothetical protein
VRTVTIAPPLGGGADQTYYGHVVSLARDGSGYLMRFDPALLLTGVTANVAAAEDAGIACRPSACAPVANDTYRLDESHRALTFRVAANVRGYVLTPKRNVEGTRVGIAELAGIVSHTSEMKLFEPLDSGVWIRVHGDGVVAFKQQYRP